jgi:hypothetical protein
VWRISPAGLVVIATLLLRALAGRRELWLVIDTDRITATVPAADAELLAAQVADLVNEHLVEVPQCAGGEGA